MMAAETIKITNEAIKEENLCKFCLKKLSKYTCPKCNAGYCSSECYKCQAHAQCSESFFRDCFMEGLKNMPVKDRQKMIDILKRSNAENEEAEGEEDEDLADRLEDLDLDKESSKVWSRLTDKERAEFESMLKNGHLGNLIDIWTPWWKKETNIKDTESVDTHPVVKSNIPKFPEALANKLSETIKYDIINVLYGYAYICRFYNGDYNNFAEECTRILLQLSPALQKQNFNSSHDALHTSFLILSDKSCNYAVSRSFSIAVIQDIVSIIEGDKQQPLVWLLAAISDIKALYKKARKIVDKKLSKSTNVETMKAHKQKFFGVEKKLEFYLSWINENGQLLKNLVPELSDEWCSLSSELEMPVVKDRKLAQIKNLDTKTLIEEI